MKRILLLSIVLFCCKYSNSNDEINIKKIYIDGPSDRIKNLSITFCKKNADHKDFLPLISYSDNFLQKTATLWVLIRQGRNFIDIHKWSKDIDGTNQEITKNRRNSSTTNETIKDDEIECTAANSYLLIEGSTEANGKFDPILFELNRKKAFLTILINSGQILEKDVNQNDELTGFGCFSFYFQLFNIVCFVLLSFNRNI